MAVVGERGISACGFSLHHKNERPRRLLRTGEAFVDLSAQQSALASSGGLGHLGGKLLGAALHFFRRDVLHMLCEAPLMAEGVG